MHHHDILNIELGYANTNWIFFKPFIFLFIRQTVTLSPVIRMCYAVKCHVCASLMSELDLYLEGVFYKI